MAAETGENLTGSNLPKSLEDKNIWLQRDLMDWCWQLHSDKTVKLIDKKHTHHFFLDKVRLMSFMKFAINALDKMRIEEGKSLRIKSRNAKNKSRERIQKIRDRVKKRQQSLFSRARKINEKK